MALIPVITVTFSNTEVIVTDVTGDYNVSTNPGGYGAPNPAFNTLAHYVVLKKKGVGDTQDATLVLDTYNPLVSTSFTYQRTIDGWYEATKLTIPIWSAGSYANGIVKYYNGTVYKANQTTSSTPGADATWDAVTDLTTIFGNTSIYTTILGRSTAFNADTYWSKQIAANSIKGLCATSIDDKQRKRLQDIKDLIQGELVADQYGDNENAEWCVQGLILLGAVWNFEDNEQF